MQEVPDGEVSSYLADDARSGDSVEVRGPVGGWFVWKPEDGGPVLLVAGGSGVVPLMAMIRSRDGVSPAPFRLIYSMRSPKDRIFDHELRRRAIRTVDSTSASSTRGPHPMARPVRSGGSLPMICSHTAGLAESRPTVYVCGPTGFVESVSDLLVGLGHDPGRIKTERFGPSGP